MHRAARSGHLDVIHQLGRDAEVRFLDERDAEGVTPLQTAIMHRADVCFVFGVTAVRIDQAECVDALLGLGSDATIVCHGIPLLQLALTYAAIPNGRMASTRIVRSLLTAGAPVTARDEEGNTVFHLMAKYGVMDCLLQACLELERIAQQCSQNDAGICKMALRDHLLMQQDVVGDTPFHVAARYGNTDVLQTFIANCTSESCTQILRTVNIDGNSPLHIAAMNGHPEAAEALLKLDPICASLLNCFGKKPVQLAIDHGHQDAVILFDRIFKSGSARPKGDELSKDWRRTHQQTWIVTCPLFHNHKTFPDGVSLRSLPPENNRRWSVLGGTKNGILHTSEFADLQWHLSPKPAQPGDVLVVHAFSYFNSIMRQCAHLPQDNSEITLLDGDTAISHGTFHCALLAAGCVCEAIDIVMKAQGRNAFCVVRPPGHHAGYRGKVLSPSASGASNGFCIFNNVAIGAAYALNVYRHAGIQKVAILDFDVHHGNGTEQCVLSTVRHRDIERIQRGEGDEVIFMQDMWRPWLGDNDRDNILFASVQGFGSKGSEDDSSTWFYPGTGDTRDGASDPLWQSRDPAHQSQMEFEEGEKLPRIINVGIPGPGNGTQFWKQSWRDKILPEVVDFNPDLILVSAGFDAHERDEVNGGFISLETHHYRWLTQKLTEVANRCCAGRLVSVLEGGYAVQGGAASAFARSVAAHVAVLNSKSLKKWNSVDEEVEAELEKEEIAEAELLQRESMMEADIPLSNENVTEAVQAEDRGHDPALSRSKRRRTAVDYVALDAKLREEASSIPL